MNKKTKAALAGLAFLAGCEIGIAIQLMRMIHKFTVRETAMEESLPDDIMEEITDEIAEEDPAADSFEVTYEEPEKADDGPAFDGELPVGEGAAI